MCPSVVVRLVRDEAERPQQHGVSQVIHYLVIRGCFFTELTAKYWVKKRRRLDDGRMECLEKEAKKEASNLVWRNFK